MMRSVLRFAIAAAAGLAGVMCASAGTATGVYVNGVSVGDKQSGTGWDMKDGYVRLTGTGPYLISGTDKTKSVGVRVASDSCRVVASNLVLNTSSCGRGESGGGRHRHPLPEETAHSRQPARSEALNRRMPAVSPISADLSSSEYAQNPCISEIARASRGATF